MLSGWHYSERLSYMISLDPQKGCVYFSILLNREGRILRLAVARRHALICMAWAGSKGSGWSDCTPPLVSPLVAVISETVHGGVVLKRQCLGLINFLLHTKS